MHKQTVLLSFFAATALAQIPGTYTPEVHPDLPTQICTKRGCKTQNTKVVLDANYRWYHAAGSTTPCISNGVFDPVICPNATACAANCAVEGANYANYGIKTNGNALTLNLFTDNGASVASPRVYLLKEDEQTYYKFRMLNREFTYDIDVSQLPCGTNGALYFSEMAADGEKNNYNKAGAYYGTGYCDAQCFSQNFISGKANYNNTYGVCCQELDIWEANSQSTAFTPHPCLTRGLQKCEGDVECGNNAHRYDGVCDKDGCAYNAYALGNHDFYGPGKTVDTTKPFTVVTQFLTKDNEDRGDLIEIRRLYVQNGKVIQNAHVNVTGISPTDNSITDDFCETTTSVIGGQGAFEKLGGITTMGDSMERGMVLAMSVWFDAGGQMSWLDGGNAGRCDSAVVGQTSYIQANYPNTQVTFSNIKVGDFGTTY